MYDLIFVFVSKNYSAFIYAVSQLYLDSLCVLSVSEALSPFGFFLLLTSCN